GMVTNPGVQARVLASLLELDTPGPATNLVQAEPADPSPSSPAYYVTLFGAEGLVLTDGLGNREPLDAITGTVPSATVYRPGPAKGAGLDFSPPAIAFGATQQGTSRVVAVTATDPSGVARLLVSTDGKSFTTYTGSVALDLAQTPRLYAFADDALGNRSPLRS